MTDGHGQPRPQTVEGKDDPTKSRPIPIDYKGRRSGETWETQPPSQPLLQGALMTLRTDIPSPQPVQQAFLLNFLGLPAPSNDTETCY